MVTQNSVSSLIMPMHIPIERKAQKVFRDEAKGVQTSDLDAE